MGVLGLDDRHEPSESRPTVRRTIAAMLERAPAGFSPWSAEIAAELGARTATLLDLRRDEARAAFGRFDATRDRRRSLDTVEVGRHHRGATILVTGGTGCIGSSLLRELATFAPARLVSISRGHFRAGRPVASVEYRRVDVCDADTIDACIAEVRPEIVYHLAAIRHPGLAELEPARTFATNVDGTRGLARAAARHGVTTFVYASTGKAVRPFTPDVYAASKKAGEWVVGEAAAVSGMRCAAARFTHVVDNSIIRERLNDWIEHRTPFRLHAPDLAFYVQSATESAQLLLGAAAQAEPGRFDVHALRDLGDPIELTDLALGALDAAGIVVPIHFCGFESGYEEHPYPGVFDVRHAGELSPLISALEADDAVACRIDPDADRFRFGAVAPEPAAAHLAQHFAELTGVCRDGAPDHIIRAHAERLSWALLDARLGTLAPDTLARAARRARLRLASGPAPGEDDAEVSAHTSGRDGVDGLRDHPGDVHRRTDAAILRAASERA